MDFIRDVNEMGATRRIVAQIGGQTKKQPKDHDRKLFIPLHTFEVIDFPVRMRRDESLGKGVYLRGGRLIRD